MNQTLLVELLTEELPPKALAKLGEAFAAGIVDGLKSRAFLETTSIATSYATPRRLAVSITNVRATSPDKPRHEKVLPVSVALDGNGNPTPSLLKKWAAMGFNGVPDIAELERRIDGKQEFLFYSGTAKGSSLQVGLLSALEQTITALPIPKVMTYQRPNGKDVSFVRPVQKLLALHGKDVIPAFVFGDDAALDADRVTLGHRFLAPGAITLEHADEYAAVLQSQGKVIASFSQRREKIRAALLVAAGDDEVLMPDALLDEVTSLVEWPAVYICNFESQFLSVPQECLILTMQTNQKYFALTDKSGRLRSRFLIVSNIETSTPSHIIEGNERVVRPRLSDAKFFFEQDQKKRLEDRIPGLASVVYHNKLGTQGERSLRVRTLASLIALASGSDAHGEALAQRAASLAKTDLLTDMVGEFPELQGIMGTYYARHDGEPEEVALAISEHYQPRFAGDALPATPTGTTVALADKLETLVGIWGIGLQPTGDRDPFALRRHALGVLRMLIEKRLPLSLQQLLTDAAQLFAGNPNFKDPTADVTSFLHDRLRGLLRERGFQPNEIEAVVAQQPDRLDNIVERLEAVRAFAALPEAEALAAANKRITNILKKVEGDIGVPDHSLCTEEAEKDLVVAVARVKIDVNAAFAKGDFTGTLMALSVLRNDVDRFFNDVMVMAEDPVLRANRIALLSELHGMMNRVADISRLAA